MLYQVTEEARKHSDTVKDKASKTAGQARDAAYDTAGTAQEQGESAWQKVKEVVTDAYEHVGVSSHLSVCYCLRLCDLMVQLSESFCIYICACVPQGLFQIPFMEFKCAGGGWSN